MILGITKIVISRFFRVTDFVNLKTTRHLPCLEILQQNRDQNYWECKMIATSQPINTFFFNWTMKSTRDCVNSFNSFITATAVGTVKSVRVEFY